MSKNTVEQLLEACKTAHSFFQRAPIEEMEMVEKALGELAPMQQLHEAIASYEASATERGIDQKEATCPCCKGKVEYFPEQDGSCEYQCLHCGWSERVPASDSIAAALTLHREDKARLRPTR